MSDVNGIKTFVTSKLAGLKEKQKTNEVLRTNDNQKRAIESFILETMNAQKLNNIQVKHHNIMLQARIKQLFKYDFLTKSMILNADLDWNKIKMMQDPSEIIPYIFEKLQKVRRTCRHTLEVKECGKRNRLKYNELKKETMPQLCRQIAEYYTKDVKTKEIRREKRRHSQQESQVYADTLSFLKRRNIKAQTFNIRGNKSEHKTVLVRRAVVQKPVSLPGKRLKIIISDIIKTKGKDLTQGDFVESLMQQLIQIQKEKAQVRERIYIDIQDA